MKTVSACPVGDSRCIDPEFAADNTGICPGAASITGLRVAPGTGQVEVGSKYPFHAYLTFSDGREKQVTTLAVWSSNNNDLATVELGVCTGRGVGVATVEATYRGYFDFGQLTVLSQCFQVGMDIALVFDRSASMTTQELDAASTRLDSAKAAARAFVANCIFTKDRVSVISYGGIYETTAAGVTTKHSDATEHLILSEDPVDVLAAIDGIFVSAPCLYDLPDGGRGNRCATGMGAGLALAKAELLSANARADTRKVVVLLTDGLENVCSPDPVVVTDEMKALFWVIAVVALDVPDNAATVCEGAATTARTYLAALSSNTLFFAVDDPDALTDIYSRIPSVICKAQTDVSFYQFPIPTFNPPEKLGLDLRNYQGFRNWDVTRGAVDLMGNETYSELTMGFGQVVSLCGWWVDGNINNVRHREISPFPFVSNASESWGTIRTKQKFSFAPGSYQVSFYCRGNGREPGSTDYITVQIGSLLKTTRKLDSRDGWGQPSWVFTVSGAASEAIEISGRHDGNNWAVGPFIDRVVLLKLPTTEDGNAEVMFHDEFDSEGPLTPPSF